MAFAIRLVDLAGCSRRSEQRFEQPTCSILLLRGLSRRRGRCGGGRGLRRWRRCRGRGRRCIAIGQRHEVPSQSQGQSSGCDHDHGSVHHFAFPLIGGAAVGTASSDAGDGQHMSAGSMSGWPALAIRAARAWRPCEHCVATPLCRHRSFLLRIRKAPAAATLASGAAATPWPTKCTSL